MPESSSAAQQRARPRHTQPRSRPDYLLDDDVDVYGNDDTEQPESKKHPPSFTCNQCSKTFTRAYNLRSHQRSFHEGERSFACTLCSETFARRNDCKRHESLHRKPMEFSCRGTLRHGGFWGCGLDFFDVLALARHLIAKRACVMPLLEEEANHPEGIQRLQRFRDQGSVEMMGLDLPTRLLEQYPALSGVEWDALFKFPAAGERVESRRSHSDVTSDAQLHQDFITDEMGFDFGSGPVGTDLFSNVHMDQIHDMQQQVSQQRLAPGRSDLAPDCERVVDSGYGSLALSTSASASSRISSNSSHRSRINLEGNAFDDGSIPHGVPPEPRWHDFSPSCASPIGPNNAESSAGHCKFSFITWDNTFNWRNPDGDDVFFDMVLSSMPVLSSIPAMSHKASPSDENILSTDEPQEPVSTTCQELQKSRTLDVSDNPDDVEKPLAGHRLCEDKAEPVDQVRQIMRQPSKTAETPSPSRARVAIYEEAREALGELRSGIEDLSDGPETVVEASESDFETLPEVTYPSYEDHGRSNPGSTEDNEENEQEDQEQGSQCRASFGSSPGAKASQLSNKQSHHKRSRPEDTGDDATRAELGAGGKRTKLSCKRFICCFHDGPGRKCSGTDETISEVIKKLSEQHDTHVCDRCWQLKIRDDASGLHFHPNGESQCSDYCLSPQCHKTTPSIGHRHLFNPEVCRRKTSRVRPGDGEAVFRFIFQIVHPELEVPAEVTSNEYALHLDAKPRQGRRKLTREELSARADELERKLDEGESLNVALNARVLELQEALATSEVATSKEKEKSLGLEKQIRRIVAMLSDALRTGFFVDDLGHNSLLARVEEDAPGALDFQSRSLLTPPGSIESQKSGLTPAGNGSDAFGPARMCEHPLELLASNGISAMTAKPDVPNNEAPAYCIPELGISDQELRDLFAF